MFSSEKDVSTYFYFLSFNNTTNTSLSRLNKKAIESSTFLLTTEINFYNKETEVWTILKGILLIVLYEIMIFLAK
jgi:hypothetical protein